VVTNGSRVHRSALLPIAIVVLAVGCSRKDAPPVAKTTTTPATAPSSAVPLDLVPMPPDTALAELKNYRLTLPTFQKWANATSALNLLTNTHPELIPSPARNPQIKTLDQLIAAFAKEPQIRSALDQAGLSPHDYVLAMMAMTSAFQLYTRTAGGAPLPAGVPPAIADNVAFLKANMPAIQHILGTIRNNPPPKLPATLPVAPKP